MHVALDRGQHDLAGRTSTTRGFFGFDEGHQMRDRFFHHAGTFHHLRQKHLAGTKQVANHVHAGHERAFNHVERMVGGLPCFLGIGFDVVGITFHQRMRETIGNRQAAPFFDFLLLAGLALETAGCFNQPLGRIGTPVEQHVFNQRE